MAFILIIIVQAFVSNIEHLLCHSLVRSEKVSAIRYQHSVSKVYLAKTSLLTADA
ncbi:hypothetical protein BH10BAC2_BH10BAC2_49480 [soil metagenome]